MTSAVSLGLRPEPLRVVLTTGADFYTVLRLDENWPAGSALALVIGGSSWSATIAGTDATFNVDKATADAVADGTTAKLVYTNGTSDQVWAVGQVVRADG